MISINTQRSKHVSLSAVLLFCILSFGYVLLRTSSVHAAPIAAATFPNPAASTNGSPMYMTIGYGDFDNPYGASYILSDTAGTVTVSIDEGQWCNVKANYTTRELDLPVSTQFLQAYFRTIFEARSISSAGNFAAAAKGSVLSGTTAAPYNAVCANRTLSFSFTLGAADLDATTGKYGAVFVARPYSFNPAYASRPAAAENSFRITVSGTATVKATFLPYVLPGLGNLFSISNRNRASPGSEGYSIDFTPGCTVNSSVGLAFYDADFGKYQSFSTYPDLNYSLKQGPKGGTASTSVISGRIEGVSGAWWPGLPGTASDLSATIDGNHTYNLTITGLSSVNAISYGISIPAAALDPSPCPPPADTAPTVSISQNCSAPYTATITIGDADYATNSGSPVINYSLNGAPQTAVRTRSQQVTMPDPTASLTIAANSNGVKPSNPGGDGDASMNRSASVTLSPCTFTFNLVPQPQPPSLDDDEAPTKGDTTSLIGFSGGATVVNGVATTRTFFINRGGTYNSATGTITGGVTLTPALSPATLNLNVNIDDKPSDNILGKTTITNFPSPLQASDNVCVSLKVDPASGQVNAAGTIQGGAGAAVTKVQCKTIVNRPYMKIFGGEVLAGSGFGSTCTSVNSGVIGFAKQLSSPAVWVGAGAQLGVFANGNVNSFASSIFIDSLNPSTTVFSNIGATGSFFGGGFDSKFCNTDYWATKQTSLSAGNGAIPALNSLNKGQYQYGGGASIDSAPLDINERIAIYVDGDVTITTNIKLSTAAVTKVEDLPSFYLVARGNIYIAPNVTQLDGVYVAMPRVPAVNLGTPADGGRIFTCTDSASAPTTAALSGACITNRLTINGMFAATHVNFLRGGGSLRAALDNEHPGSANIAETFNFIPEVLLGVPAPSAITTGQYDSVISLPPAL